MSHPEAKWMVREISRELVGWTLTEAFEEEISKKELRESYRDWKYYGLVFQRDEQRRIVWVLSDEEGNNVGFLDIGKPMTIPSRD